MLAAASFLLLTQVSIKSLRPAHAVALAHYLRKNQAWEFLPESSFGEGLSGLKKEFHNRLTPYYATGDFSHDGIPDFAVIVASSRPPKQNGDIFNYMLGVVIFNGLKRKGYRVAFEKGFESPLTCLLASSGGKRPTLRWGLDESDSNMIFTPVRGTYVVEHDDIY